MSKKDTEKCECKDIADLMINICVLKPIIDNLYNALNEVKAAREISELQGVETNVFSCIFELETTIFDLLEEIELLHIEDINYRKLTENELKLLHWFYEMLIFNNQPTQINALSKKTEVSHCILHYNE